MKTEKAIQSEILCGLSDECILFRTNAGQFYQGKKIFIPKKVIEFAAKFGVKLSDSVITFPKIVKGLPKGYTDISGHRISDGRAVYLEVKKHDGVVREEQIHFIETMKGKVRGLLLFPQAQITTNGQSFLVHLIMTQC